MADFRKEAQSALSRAINELSSGEDSRVRYAALELRFAMEALTYERAARYEDEFPPSEYEVWQPKKLMQQMLDLDPYADKDVTIYYGGEDVPGEPAREMRAIGKETVLSYSVLKRHYDAIGNFLHMPTLKQMKAVTDVNILRTRCEEILEFLKRVLESPVWNSFIAEYASARCECGQIIRRRMPYGKTEVRARCLQCGKVYQATDVGEGKTEWKAVGEWLRCANDECRDEVFLNDRDVHLGAFWTCQKCGGTNKLVIGVKHSPPPKEDVQ